MACDEFYTVRADIDTEAKFYDFSGRVVYCPCDNYEWSEFARFFSENFARLGLRGLMCSCIGTGDLFTPYQHGFVVEYDGERWTPPRHIDGDFRSADCAALRARADVICTNPPFSLFTDFFFWMKSKEFLVIFPQTALTQNRIFPHFMRGECWLGRSIRTHGRLFRVPDYFELRHKHHSRVRGGVKYCEVDSARWLTNMGERVEKDLQLTEVYTPERYPFLDGTCYPNVEKKGEIPRDYFGVLAVPASFFNYWNPAQFAVVGKMVKPRLNGVAKNTRILIQRVDQNV